MNTHLRHKELEVWAFPIVYMVADAVIQYQVDINLYPTLQTFLMRASHKYLYSLGHFRDLRCRQRGGGKAQAVEEAGAADTDRLRGQHTAETDVAELATQYVAYLADIGGGVSIGAKG